jgi:hypothetical protein
MMSHVSDEGLPPDAADHDAPLVSMDYLLKCPKSPPKTRRTTLAIFKRLFRVLELTSGVLVITVGLMIYTNSMTL